MEEDSLVKELVKLRQELQKEKEKVEKIDRLLSQARLLSSTYVVGCIFFM